MTHYILVVEDEPSIAELIAVNLAHAGYEVERALQSDQALSMINRKAPSLIVLDWMLPGKSGVQFAKELRANERTRGLPILMLTARGDESDKVTGLDSGADDYITKPFSTQELLARFRAVLRRRAPEQASDVVRIGALQLDGSTHRVSYNDQGIELGPTEFKLLNYLMHHAERVHSRSQLLDRVWGDHVFIEERTVDVHVKRLREALGAAGCMVETVRGAGYRLTAHAKVPGSPAPAAPALAG